MKKLLSIIVIVCMALSLSAQWSSDPSVNNIVYSDGETFGSLTATDEATGMTYIQWFVLSSSGMRPMMQLYDNQGIAQWQENGIIISTNQNSTALYGTALEVSSDGCALVAFADSRNDDMNPFIYKISQTGEFLWGDNGVQLSNSEAYRIYVYPCNDGSAWAAWYGETCYMRHINADGTTDPLITIENDSDFGHVICDENNNAIMAYFHQTGGAFMWPNREVKVCKYNTSGAQIWLATIIAENLVIPDFQRLDARLLPLALLDFLQHLLAVVSDTAILVKLRVIAAFNDAALPDGKTRLVDNGAFQKRNKFVICTDAVTTATEQSGLRRCKHLLDAGQCSQGKLQRNEIPRVRRADLRPRQEPLEIVDFLHAFTKARPHGKLLRKLLDGVMARTNIGHNDKRLFQPFAEQSPSHRRARKIEDVKQRILLASVPQVSCNLEIPKRRRIQHKPPRRFQPRQSADMAQVGHDRLMQVIEKRRKSRFRALVSRTLLRTEMAKHHFLGAINGRQ